MKGEDEFNKAYEEGLSEISGDKDSLYGVHPLKRALIAFGGPLFNLILTVISFIIIALTGYSYWSASSQIRLATDVYPEMYSAAKEAGLLSGDIITSINDTEIPDFAELFSFVSIHPDEDLSIKVLRNEESLTFTVHSQMDKNTGAGKIGVISCPETTVKREAKTYNLPGAIIKGFTETYSMFKATIKGITSLFKGVKITQAVSGPASITTMLGETVKTGFAAGFRTGISSVLNFIALISISLFIMNLLPVPVLDGGLILFSFIEAIFHIHISPKVRYRIQYIGLAFIAVLFIIAVIGDFNYFMRLFDEK